MQGLVAYESSDEDEPKLQQSATKVNGTATAVSRSADQNRGATAPDPPVLDVPAQAAAARPDPALQHSADELQGGESPSTASRRIMQNLTLPPIPHIDIPPSPPGSPDPAATKKIERFLELKAQGVHLNETLSSKPAFRNPSMFGNLVDFANIGEKESYASALPADLQIGGPDGFHESQYVESLEAERKKKDQAAKKTRDSVGFSKATQAAGSKRLRE